MGTSCRLPTFCDFRKNGLFFDEYIKFYFTCFFSKYNTWCGKLKTKPKESVQQGGFWTDRRLTNRTECDM